MDSIAEQTVIPMAFEIRLSRYDPDASPQQGANQYNAPIMLAMYKFLDFQSQAKVQKQFSGDTNCRAKHLLIPYVFKNAYRNVFHTGKTLIRLLRWYRQSSTAKSYIAASLTRICKSNYDYDIIYSDLGKVSIWFKSSLEVCR